jgi:hypothetical protein
MMIRSRRDVGDVARRMIRVYRADDDVGRFQQGKRGWVDGGRIKRLADYTLDY